MDDEDGHDRSAVQDEDRRDLLESERADRSCRAVAERCSTDIATEAVENSAAGFRGTATVQDVSCRYDERWLEQQQGEPLAVADLDDDDDDGVSSSFPLAALRSYQWDLSGAVHHWHSPLAVVPSGSHRPLVAADRRTSTQAVVRNSSDRAMFPFSRRFPCRSRDSDRRHRWATHSFASAASYLKQRTDVCRTVGEEVVRYFSIEHCDDAAMGPAVVAVDRLVEATVVPRRREHWLVCSVEWALEAIDLVMMVEPECSDVRNASGTWARWTVAHRMENPSIRVEMAVG